MLYGSVSSQEGTLKGRIIFDGVLRGLIRTEAKLKGSIKTNGILHGSLMITEEFDSYVGLYNVTPRISSQSIPTANKLMNDDVTVNGIPYYEVSNQQGGTTFIIAEN